MKNYLSVHATIEYLTDEQEVQGLPLFLTEKQIELLISLQNQYRIAVDFKGLFIESSMQHASSKIANILSAVKSNKVTKRETPQSLTINQLFFNLGLFKEVEKTEEEIISDSIAKDEAADRLAIETDNALADFRAENEASFN